MLIIKTLTFILTNLFSYLLVKSSKKERLQTTLVIYLWYWIYIIMEVSFEYIHNRFIYISIMEPS